MNAGMASDTPKAVRRIRSQVHPEGSPGTFPPGPPEDGPPGPPVPTGLLPPPKPEPPPVPIGPDGPPGPVARRNTGEDAGGEPRGVGVGSLGLGPEGEAEATTRR